MAKGKQSTSDRVIHEGKNGATILLWVVVAVFLILPMLPVLLDSLSRNATKAAVDSAKTPAGALAAGYGAYKLGPKLKGKVQDWQQSRASTEDTTPPTTAAPAEPRPYGAPNGKVKPIVPDGVAPRPGPNLPQLGGANTGGPIAGAIEAVPGIGPALGGALKALPKGGG